MFPNNGIPGGCGIGVVIVVVCWEVLGENGSVGTNKFVGMNQWEIKRLKEGHQRGKRQRIAVCIIVPGHTTIGCGRLERVRSVAQTSDQFELMQLLVPNRFTRSLIFDRPPTTALGTFLSLIAVAIER